jgi:subtilisin family serine protease
MSAAHLKDFAPNPDHTRAALMAAPLLGLEVTETAHNNLTAQISAADFEKTFGTKVQEVQYQPSESAPERLVFTARFLQPESEVKVPAELAATIDFAYVPTPPVFFAPRPIAPPASVYHLRVEEVARLLRAYRCHRQGWTGRGVRVVMADTGFARHPFFDQYDFNITRVSTPSTNNPEVDTSGHGTGESANVLVVAPDCIFFGVKHDDYSAEALETSLAQNPKVMTNSWGWNVDHQSLPVLRTTNPNLYNELIDVERIIKEAVAAGVTIVFAGGNGQRAFPGSLPEVISVGGVSVSATGELSASSYASSFTSQLYPGRNVPDFCGIVGEAGPPPLKGHIMLPVPNNCELEGENMPASHRGKGWGIFSGTSAAAPQVAGVIALMLSVNPNLTPAQLKGILAATATDVQRGTTTHNQTARVGLDLATGAGLVNALNACLRAQQMLSH